MASTNTTNTTTAVLYDRTTMNEPLLESALRESGDRHVAQGPFRRASLCIGLLVGLMMQLSLLGANFVLLSSFSETANALVGLEALSTLICYATAATIFVGMRHLLISMGNKDESELDEQADALLSHFESQFLVGSFVGVCFCRIVVDMSLGEAFWQQATLVTGLLWCAAVRWWGNVETEEKEEETVSSQRQRGGDETGSIVV